MVFYGLQSSLILLQTKRTLQRKQREVLEQRNGSMVWSTQKMTKKKSKLAEEQGSAWDLPMQLWESTVKNEGAEGLMHVCDPGKSFKVSPEPGLPSLASG